MHKHHESAQILKKLKSMGSPADVAGMARYGINPHNTLGVPIPELRALAKETGTNHAIALELWESGIHEARILAGMIADPVRITDKQMDHWAGDLDSWDVTDQCCANLFEKTPLAVRKAFEWSKDRREFVKRAGYTLIARIAVSDKKSPDELFMAFLPVIGQGAADERNFVKKAVNWALRQIGKRNAALNRAAIKTAHDIQKMDSRPARWIAADALRELTGEPVQAMLKRRSSGRRPQ